MKSVVTWSLLGVGLGLFVVAWVVNPQGVPESVWTGIATGLFTTGLVEWVLSSVAARERKEEVDRRAALIAPLAYCDGVVDLALTNDGGEVAIHVVVGTNFPADEGLMHTRAVQRAIEWAPMTFDQAIYALDNPQLEEELPWQSGRVPIEFAQVAPSTSPRVRIRLIGTKNPQRPLEVPVRVAWSVPGDPLRYKSDFLIIFESADAAQFHAL